MVLGLGLDRRELLTTLTLGSFGLRTLKTLMQLPSYEVKEGPNGSFVSTDIKKLPELLYGLSEPGHVVIASGCLAPDGMELRKAIQRGHYGNNDFVVRCDNDSDDKPLRPGQLETLEPLVKAELARHRDLQGLPFHLAMFNDEILLVDLIVPRNRLDVLRTIRRGGYEVQDGFLARAVNANSYATVSSFEIFHRQRRACVELDDRQNISSSDIGESPVIP